MKKKILLIEDDSTLRKNTLEILELANFSVETAENGKIGIEIAKTFMPNIIVCDISMPVLDGYGVLQIISKLPILNQVPFIFLKSKTLHEDFRKGMEMGADDYLFKPFKKSELLRAIETRIKRVKVFENHDNLKNLDKPLLTANETITIETLLESKKIYKYNEGETIYCRGNQSNHLFFVKKGLIKTFKNNELGKEFITGFYKEKEYFGYTSFIKHIPHFENSKAITDVEIYKVNEKEVLKLINENSKFLIKFINVQTTEIIESKNQSLLLAYGSVREKTAKTILNLLKILPIKSENEILISRSNLANSIGIAKETLIRTLHDFKEEKLIKLTPKSIIILNNVKLQKVK